MKDKTYNEFKIKVDKVVDVKKIGVGEYENTDRFYLVDIKHFGGGIAFGVKASGKHKRDLRKVFHRIMEELHIS